MYSACVYAHKYLSIEEDYHSNFVSPSKRCSIHLILNYLSSLVEILVREVSIFSRNMK